MGRVVHFELSVDDPERAVAFYTEVFGWTVEKWEGPQDYWLVSTGEGPGIDGAIMPREEGWQPTVNTIDVEDVDAATERVTAAGGSVVMPKHAIPGVGYFAYCQDAAGITFGMMQSDTSASA